jgi:hypothetical protein
MKTTLPDHLERTYQALIKFSSDGVVFGTPRQLVAELQLKSPAPLFARIKRLESFGVIRVVPA